MTGVLLQLTGSSPGRLPRLWTREEDTDDRPFSFVDHAHKLRVHRVEDGWRISPVSPSVSLDSPSVSLAPPSHLHHHHYYYYVHTAALHPATIPTQDVWYRCGRAGEREETTLSFEHYGLVTSHDHPARMRDLGEDLFVYRRHMRIFWYVDPVTGETHHSGAKTDPTYHVYGKRYCPFCRKSMSANNFVTQHLPQMHRIAPPSEDCDGLQEVRAFSARLESLPPSALLSLSLS